MVITAKHRGVRLRSCQSYGFGGIGLSEPSSGRRCRMICLMIRTIGFSPPMSRPGRSPRANMGVAVISIPASRSVAIDLRISSSEPARFGTGCVVLLLLFGGRAPVHQVVTGKGRLLPCATQEEVKKV